jgi:phosphoribosylamine-glycine ligase
MYSGNYGEMLHAIASGGIPDESWRAAYGTSVRLTIPPYPTEVKVKKIMGTPIKGLDIEDQESVLQTYMYDVMQLRPGELCCAGLNGFLLAPVCVGSEPLEAFLKLEDRIKKFDIPDMQYRTDIKKSTMKRYAELVRMGWI